MIATDAGFDNTHPPGAVRSPAVRREGNAGAPSAFAVLPPAGGRRCPRADSGGDSRIIPALHTHGAGPRP